LHLSSAGSLPTASLRTSRWVPWWGPLSSGLPATARRHPDYATPAPVPSGWAPGRRQPSSGWAIPYPLALLSSEGVVIRVGLVASYWLAGCLTTSRPARRLALAYRPSPSIPSIPTHNHYSTSVSGLASTSEHEHP
jgi:hypothetical protein